MAHIPSTRPSGTGQQTRAPARLALLEQFVHDVANELGDLFGDGIGKASPAPISAPSTAPMARRHAHPPGQRDRRIGKEPAHPTLRDLRARRGVLAVLQLFERVVVALVQQEEIAVGDDLIDELVEQLRPRPGLVSSRINLPSRSSTSRPSSCSRMCSCRRMSSLRSKW